MSDYVFPGSRCSERNMQASGLNCLQVMGTEWPGPRYLVMYLPNGLNGHFEVVLAADNSASPWICLRDVCDVINRTYPEGDITLTEDILRPAIAEVKDRYRR